MKAQGNWKVWEKGNCKRVYISENAYLIEGDTGLCILNGEADREYLFSIIGNHSFNEIFEATKCNQTAKKSTKKTAKEKRERFAEICKIKDEIERDGLLKEEGYI